MKSSNELAKILTDYESKGYNLLLPSKTLQQDSLFHEPTVDVVQLSPDDCYPQDNSDPEKATRFSIGKTGLMKFAHAAAISWSWSECKRTDPATDRNYVSYQAVGALQKADGRWLSFKGSYEIDMEVVEEDLRQLYSKMATGIRRKQNSWIKTDEDERSYIESSVKRELLRRRKHKLRLCETGALLAVIRALLAIKATYSRDELSKPFVVPRIVFKPDLEDPDIRRAVILGSMKAVAETFGGPQSFTGPIGALPDPIQIPHTEAEPEVFPETTTAQVTHTEPEPESSPGDLAGQPFDTPPESSPTEVPEIKSLKDLETISDGQLPDAIRKLMAVKDYSEKLLKNRLIETWSKENQVKFVTMLLERFPDKKG